MAGQAVIPGYPAPPSPDGAGPSVPNAPAPPDALTEGGPSGTSRLTALTPSATVSLAQSPSASEPPDSQQAALFTLPLVAQQLAQSLAQGTALDMAMTELSVMPHEAREWLSHPDWPALMRSFLLTPKQVESELSRLVPLALGVKEAILRDATLSPQLRDSAASDVLDRLGYGRIERKEVKVFKVEGNLKDLLSNTAKELS